MDDKSTRAPPPPGWRYTRDSDGFVEDGLVPDDTPRQSTRHDCSTCRLLLPLSAPHDAYAVCTWVPPAWPSNVMQSMHDSFSMQQDHRRWVPLYEVKREPTRLNPCGVWEPHEQ